MSDAERNPLVFDAEVIDYSMSRPDGRFRMFIEEVFKITNRGYALCGLATGSEISVNDTVSITENDGTPFKSAVVRGLERYKETRTTVKPGEAFGMLINDEDGIGVKRGMWVVK